MIAILILTLQVNAPATDVGEIWVRTDPGVLVYLDGVKAGVAAAEQGGLWLRKVPAGTHDLLLQITGGGSTTMKVAVVTGQTTTITVPSLALRTPRTTGTGKSALEIQLAQPESDCFATLGARREAITQPITLIDDVTPGKLRLSVSCGGRSLKKDVDVLSGRTVIIEANFAAKSLNIAGDWPRVTQVTVRSTTENKVLEAPISATAKRAILRSLSPGMVVLGVNLLTERVVDATLEAPSLNAIPRFVERLKKADGVESVQVEVVQRVEGSDRAVFNLTIFFSK